MLDSIKHKPVVVIGGGSIGERHIGILLQMGFTNVLVYRQRGLPFRTIDQNAVTTITNWNAVLEQQPYAAIICSPTQLHVQQLIDCIDAGMHVLVEKPLSAEKLSPQLFTDLLSKKSNLHIQIAYMLRYHPFVKEIRTLIESKRYGQLLKANTYWGEYLPNWHPWEDYRQSYAAKKEMGGGVAITLSHDIEMLCYVMQDTPVAWHCSKQFKTPLEVDVESAADIIMEFPNGIHTNSHVNFFEKAARRFYRFIFEDASLEYNYFTNTLSIETPEGVNTKQYEGFERNDMFAEQSAVFFEECQRANTSNSIQNIQRALALTNICL